VPDARDLGWGWPGAPGSAAEASYRRAHIAVVSVAGIRLAVRREVAHLFVGFITELVGFGYRLDVNADDWGFANRDVRGAPGAKSNHSWGLAVDLNALDNPMAEAHPAHGGSAGHDARGVHTDMPAETAGLASTWGLRWGANYAGSRKDAMHFEFVGAPGDVARYPLRPRTPQEAHVLVPGIVATTLVPGATPDALGRFPFWAVKADGSVLAFNGAPFFGPHRPLGTSAVIGIHARTDRTGYVLVTNDADDASGAATYAFPAS
jgi:hypothetical protein